MFVCLKFRQNIKTRQHTFQIRFLKKLSGIIGERHVSYGLYRNAIVFSQ